MGLPPSVDVDIANDDLLSYWWARALQHVEDSYAGVALCKFPEDLRTYEHLLWTSAADTVIEIGTFQGGSALWFRDRLRVMHGYRRIERPPHVISIDIDQSIARSKLASADPSFAKEIDLVEADVTDPALPDRVASQLRPQARCFVVEDSAHVVETTRAALDGFARFVPGGGFFVVEDGNVDIEELRLPEHLLPGVQVPRGVLSALGDWLATPQGAQFTVRRDLELYGVSAHPRGFLQRRGDGLVTDTEPNTIPPDETGASGG
jgi:cephalosporin hydroxylase